MANFWMTVGSPHLHTDDRVRRTLCRQHVLLSAVTMTITVLENYKLCGGTSAAVRLSPDFLSLKKNQNAPTPSEHPPVMGKKCQNV